MKPLPRGKIITSFAGLRAHGDMGDFIIGEAEGAPLFYDLAGIESPGLSSAPAIGEMGIPHFAELPFEEKQKLIEKNPLYGQIVCRCETVTEGEIVDAIRRPLGARSLDGIKRRTRAGMGRCQSGFCLPRVCEILHRETGIPQDMITKCGGSSRVAVGYTKGEKEPRDREDGRHPHEEM